MPDSKQWSTGLDPDEVLAARLGPDLPLAAAGVVRGEPILGAATPPNHATALLSQALHPPIGVM
jgi:hypothetical protein